MMSRCRARTMPAVITVPPGWNGLPIAHPIADPHLLESPQGTKGSFVAVSTFSKARSGLLVAPDQLRLELWCHA